MKAAVLYEKNDIKFEEVEEKRIYPNEVKIKVYVAGICGSDTHKMATKWKYPLPAVMGHEFAGEIIEVGSDVKNVSIGERVAVAPLIPCNECVYCKQGQFSLCENYTMIGSHRYGGFAEKVTVPASNVIPIGDLSYEEGAMLEPLAVAMHAVQGIAPKLGDTALVFGIGTIGILVIQALKLTGVRSIIAVDINEDKLEEAKKYGATHVINSIEEKLEERVFELTNGLGVAVAMECAGSVITQEQALRVVAKRGKVGYVGIAYKDVLLPEKTFEKIFRRELTVKGFWNSYSAPFPGREWRNGLEFVQQGKIDLKSMVTHRFPLSQTKEAFDMMLNRTDTFNKVLIEVNGEEIK